MSVFVDDTVGIRIASAWRNRRDVHWLSANTASCRLVVTLAFMEEATRNAVTKSNQEITFEISEELLSLTLVYVRRDVVYLFPLCKLKSDIHVQ